MHLGAANCVVSYDAWEGRCEFFNTTCGTVPNLNSPPYLVPGVPYMGPPTL